MAADGTDLTNRWVLNIAHMARGTWPDGLSEAMRIPPAAFASDADIGRFIDVAPAAGLAPADQAGGAIVATSRAMGTSTSSSRPSGCAIRCGSTSAAATGRSRSGAVRRGWPG